MEWTLQPVHLLTNDSCWLCYLRFFSSLSKRRCESRYISHRRLGYATAPSPASGPEAGDDPRRLDPTIHIPEERPGSEL